MQTDTQKQALFQQTEQQLREQGFTIANQDQSRPWGGFFVINEDQAQAFADAYFDGMAVEELRISGKLSPKILIVAPQKRLSWQYHHRRAEVWKVLQGPVGVVTSLTDEEGELKSYAVGELITLKQGARNKKSPRRFSLLFLPGL